MKNFNNAITAIKKFRDARDWKQFHNPRNLAESLVLEAAEVMEHFQWKTDREIKEHLKKNKRDFSHELADVLHYLILLAEETNVDLLQAVEEKLAISELKYPVSKSKGKAIKYNKLK